MAVPEKCERDIGVGQIVTFVIFFLLLLVLTGSVTLAVMLWLGRI